jgi:hypothetical protein
MMDILLSMPAFYVYLVFVGPLLITALLTRESGPPVGEPRPTARTAGQGLHAPPSAARFSSNRVGVRERALPRGPASGPYRGLHAALSADYASKVDQAITRVRL